MSISSYKKAIYNTVWGTARPKVYHAYAKYYNFGDHALAYGVKNVFLEYFNAQTRFKDIDIHETVFDKKTIEKINRFADILIVGGGGLIHTFGSKFWLFNLDDKNIKLLKTPVCFFGVGYNNFNSTKLHKGAIKNIKLLKKKALSFSIRNDGSKERLDNIGLSFEEIPDPGFFVDGNHPRPKIEGDYVILQIANDAANERNTNNNTFLQNMVELCKYLIHNNYTVVLTPHCFPDIDVSNKIVQIIQSPKVFSWNWFDIIREDNVSKGLGYYKYAAFVIAMRGHAQICPIGMGVPVITIINHPKHLGLLQKLNMMNLWVAVTDQNFMIKIKSLIKYVEKNKTKIKQKNIELVNQLMIKTKLFIETLIKKLERNKQKQKLASSFKLKIYYKIWKHFNKKYNSQIFVSTAQNSDLLKSKSVNRGGYTQRLQYKIWKHLGKRLRKKGIIK